MSSNSISTESVWRLLSARLTSFIRSRVADEQTTLDLLQETYLRIHKNLDNMRSHDRIEAWVFQIARNLITDYHRSKSTSVEFLDADPKAELDEPDNINEQVASWLPLMIQLLPEPNRAAVELYELEGLSQQSRPTRHLIVWRQVAYSARSQAASRNPSRLLLIRCRSPRQRARLLS